MSDTSGEGKKNHKATYLDMTPTRGHATIWGPAQTYLHQLCTETQSNLEDLPGVIDYRKGLTEIERVRFFSSFSMISNYRGDDLIYIYIYIYTDEF